MVSPPNMLKAKSANEDLFCMDDASFDLPPPLRPRPRERAYSELYQVPEATEFANHHLNLNHFEMNDCLSQQRSNDQAYFGN